MVEKVETALNETRILVLIVQVLIGFQFQSAFTREFEWFPRVGQLTVLLGLALQLLALALLLIPPAYHKIVESCEPTRRMCRLATKVVGIALVLLAVALGLQFAAITAKAIGRELAVVLGCVLGGTALFFWWGLELAIRLLRRYNKGGTRASRPGSTPEGGRLDEKCSLSDKMKFALTETRVVLPGSQALLGFQFTCILTEPFNSLPASMKHLHLIGLGGVALSAILLMAPAAFHRIVEDGESTDRVLRFTGSMLLAAMTFLALGIGCDVYVVTEKVTKSAAWSAAGAALTVLVSFGLWFGYSLLTRANDRTRAGLPIANS